MEDEAGMAIYKTKWFSRWARKEGLSDQVLREAVREMQDGLYEANLGGNLVKKRIARSGKGKSGGFRTLVATAFAGRWFFIYGFAKSARDNIDPDEEASLKKLAEVLLEMPPAALGKALDTGELKEVEDHG